MMFIRMAVVSAIAALLFTFCASAQQGPNDLELVKMLREGGYVIVMRHGATANDVMARGTGHDQAGSGAGHERQLSDKGEQAARTLGVAFKTMGVPVGKAITSNLNRAYQTAKLAGFDNIEKTADVTESGRELEPSENARRAAALRELANTPPAAGINILVVTHKPNVVDAFGMDWADVKEGEATIFKPGPDKPVVVARVQIGDWPRIAAAK